MATLVVFDLDGTLIDSRHDLADAANALIAERGGRTLPVDAIAAMVGEGASLLVRRALTAAGLDPESTDALPRFLELYDERLLVHTRMYDGIVDVLAQLHSRHALAILTNKPLRATNSILEGLGIATYFGQVRGGDGPYPRKPDPAALFAIARSARTGPDQTCVVGDSPIDLATARAAGTHIVLAAYGFGFERDMPPLTPGELIARRPSDVPGAIELALYRS